MSSGSLINKHPVDYPCDNCRILLIALSAVSPPLTSLAIYVQMTFLRLFHPPAFWFLSLVVNCSVAFLPSNPCLYSLQTSCNVLGLLLKVVAEFWTSLVSSPSGTPLPRHRRSRLLLKPPLLYHRMFGYYYWSLESLIYNRYVDRQWRLVMLHGSDPSVRPT
jgi:hypothetical protein